MRWLAAPLVVLVLAGCGGTSTGVGTPRSAGQRVSSGDPADLHLSQPRAVHRATVLLDGSVLITGGCTEPGCGGFDAGRRAELYDAAVGLAPGAEMATPRASGTATLLADGRVLLTGGYPGEGMTPTAAAEVYDPAAGSFSPVGELLEGRADHTATVLTDGRVLLAGGFAADGRALRTSELFDPATGTFSPGPALSAPRAAQVAALVDGAVLLVGGTVGNKALSSTDVFRDGAWTAGPLLATARVKSAIASIGAGRALVVGGATTTEGHRRLASTEIVDLGRGSVRRGPDLGQGEYKLDGAVTTLPDGRVVIASGPGLELFDPGTETLRRVPVPAYDARSFRTLSLVGPLTVLVAGGYDESITPTDEAVLVTLPAA